VLPRPETMLIGAGDQFCQPMQTKTAGKEK